MKVHIVTSANRGFYADALQQMHRLRHKYFVEDMRWEALRSEDGLEIDEYDDRFAVYLLAIDNGVVEGSLRLLPTWRRSLLGEHFAHFVTETVCPTGVDIWEWTRWAPGSPSRPRNLIHARRALILASLEFALSRGVEAFSAICDMKFLGQMVELGWSPQPLGLPTAFAEGTAVALFWRVTPNILKETRRVLSHPWPAALEAPACPDASVKDPALDTELLANFVSLQSAPALEEIEQTIKRHSPAGGARINLRTMAMQGNA